MSREPCVLSRITPAHRENATSWPCMLQESRLQTQAPFILPMSARMFHLLLQNVSEAEEGRTVSEAGGLRRETYLSLSHSYSQ